MKVLVVDDEPEIRDLCKVNLEFAGHEVAVAGNGREAIDSITADPPDFVFLDLMMPGVDGWAVLRAIREGERTAHIPVVLLTARASEEDQARGWTEGIFDYIVKPFNPLSLAEWVDQAQQAPAGAVSERRREQALAQLRFLEGLR